jgi:phosphate starvation-inducible PhoH-like protein
MATVTLQYESARQAQQLFDNNPANLRLLREELEIQATSRDGWIKLEGDDDNLAQAQDVFASLKDQLDTGQRPRQRDLVKAIQTVKEDGGEALRGLKSQTIRTSPRKPSVIPKTVGQKEYIQAITTHDITFGVGPAGTGKTYLAMAMAVSALQRGDVSRIILTRPAVEAGEALGFLPGDLREKLSPYLRPLHDALLDMIPVEEVQRHMERETIEIAPLAYMRGRTLNNAFVILDEAQNTTNEQMFMFLTRLGYHSKAIVTGDPTQIDLPTSKQSGLLEALLTLRKTEGVAIKKFAQNDVVRHPLVQKIINAYETRRNRE